MVTSFCRSLCLPPVLRTESDRSYDRRVLIRVSLHLNRVQTLLLYANAANLPCSRIPWATLATCSISYASEVLPPSIRTYLTSYTNMCFIIGQLISAGVLKGFSGHTSQWAYRIPFAIQWVWPVILIPLVYIAPESPWHLVRMGRLDEAMKSLERLKSKTATNVSTANTLATIIHTDSYEERNKIGSSYLDCFKGPELRRSEIACMTFASQAFIGIQFAYSSTYFFQSIGVGTEISYDLNLGGTCMGLFACFVNWFRKCLALRFHLPFAIHPLCYYLALHL